MVLAIWSKEICLLVSGYFFDVTVDLLEDFAGAMRGGGRVFCLLDMCDYL